jgi:hypothetical protein
MKPRKVMTAVSVGTLAIALTGCMKLDMTLELNNDDTVDGTMIFAFDKSVAGFMGEEFDTMMDGMVEDTTDMPEGATAEPYEDDTYEGAEYTFTGSPLSEFNDEDMTITHEDGEWELTGTMDLTEEEVGSQDDLGDFGDISEMADFDVRIAVTFPGEVLETNGEVDGTTVTWRPTFGESAEMHARAGESGGGSGDGLPAWLWIVIAVVVLAALLGGLFIFSRGQKASSSVPATAPSEGGGAPANVPPPPPAADEAVPTEEAVLADAPDAHNDPTADDRSADDSDPGTTPR